jgi:hypothetical protein
MLKVLIIVFASIGIAVIVALFGEFVPGDIPCFAAWNVMRSVEGGKPTFEDRQWLGIGRINQDSCRWLR